MSYYKPNNRIKTQKEHFYDSQRKIAEQNDLFLFFVSDGMTKKHLQTNINKNPALWGRFSNWLDVLE